ncbi:hypothetical protein MAR_025389 [Mya arenaria]|uniref:Uncharacterized protein n=1 Tax=Mya arenaria TaxID=6604 RepID=A0ABY7DWN5_MYAAR|nr:uncharacterized protein LOC128227044 [Mya arenaria]XP_052793356.1 uncharacterized protein LOC128227149 [Mya arenaria]WAR01017.1 hypothetical protein MAR_025389 [Mya arenaria]
MVDIDGGSLTLKCSMNDTSNVTTASTEAECPVVEPDCAEWTDVDTGSIFATYLRTSGCLLYGQLQQHGHQQDGLTTFRLSESPFLCAHHSDERTSNCLKYAILPENNNEPLDYSRTNNKLVRIRKIHSLKNGTVNLSNCSLTRKSVTSAINLTRATNSRPEKDNCRKRASATLSTQRLLDCLIAETLDTPKGKDPSSIIATYISKFKGIKTGRKSPESRECCKAEQSRGQTEVGVNGCHLSFNQEASLDQQVERYLKQLLQGPGKSKHTGD